MIRVCAFTGGISVPSARFRVRQYVSGLQREGVVVSEKFPRLGKYPPAMRVVRPAWAVGSLIERLPSVLDSYRYDLTLLQREMLSSYFTLESFTSAPRILDVDDAIWLHRRGIYARRLVSICDAVICGNSYIADYFGQFNRHIYVIPTAVDTEVFLPRQETTTDTEALVIGWSGTSSGLHNLCDIEPALNELLTARRDVTLRVMCDRPPQFSTLPASRIDYVPWSANSEVSVLQSFHIGVMPLEDSPWAKGKCSYKMLLYMACGIPVVVSPVGMNADVLALGTCGLAAKSLSHWIESLAFLLDSHSARREYGRRGREIVATHFATRIIVPQLAQVFRRWAAAV